MVRWQVGVVLALAACSPKDKRDVEPTRVSEPGPGALPVLAPNAPKDRPVEVGTAERRARIAALTEQARASYPDAKRRFLAGLPAGEHFFVITTLTSGAARETVFVAVSRIADGQVTGTIASDIVSVKGYRKGDAYTFPETAFVDWLISKPDGSEEGNLVGKYLDAAG